MYEIPLRNSIKLVFWPNSETRVCNLWSACLNLMFFGGGSMPDIACSTLKSLEFCVVFKRSTKVQRLGWLPPSTLYRARWAASATLLVLSVPVSTLLCWFHNVTGNKGCPLLPIFFFQKSTRLLTINRQNFKWFSAQFS